MSSESVAAWKALSAGGTPTHGEFRVFVSDVAAAEGKALYALDAQGLRHLLIPVREGVRIEADDRSNGVHVIPRVLLDGAAASHFVDIACRKPHLAEVFSHLVDEVIEELRREPGRPASTARRVLNRWRELIEREIPNLLSEERLLGLFGELHILRRLAEETSDAVAMWTGPLGSRFDFQRYTRALEVKTVAAGTDTSVHIHGVDQLEPPPGGTLHLWVLSVERRSATGESIPALIARIRERGVDALALSSKLHSAGYAEHDELHYAEVLFSVLGEQVFRVDSAFPRIVRESFNAGDLPPRVGSLRYTIDLTSPPPVPLGEAYAYELLKQMAAH